MEDVADTAKVGNGCVLGFPDVSNDLTIEPLVIGGSLGVGKDCGPKLRTALGLAAGGTSVVGKLGMVAAKENELITTKEKSASIMTKSKIVMVNCNQSP